MDRVARGDGLCALAGPHLSLLRRSGHRPLLAVMGRFSDEDCSPDLAPQRSKFHADQYHWHWQSSFAAGSTPGFIEEYESDALRQYGDTLSTFAGPLARSRPIRARDLPNDRPALADGQQQESLQKHETLRSAFGKSRGRMGTTICSARRNSLGPEAVGG